MIFRNIVTASVLSVALLVGCTNTGDQPEPSVASAPDFALQDTNGKTVKLSDYRGKVVLLEFWTTWCPPCRASIPSIKKIHKAYKAKGLVVLAVSLDESDWNLMKAFVKDYGITYPVLKGTDEIGVQYRVRAIPMMLILDKEGRVFRRHEGFGNEEDLEKDIKAIL